MSDGAAATTTPGVVVVGDVLVDELTGPAGTTRRPGGAGLNLARSVRRLGVPATLAAPVAADADGEWLAAAAHEAGVDLIRLPHPGPTGVAVSQRVGGEPTYRFSASVLQRRYAWDPGASSGVAAAGRVLVVNSFPMHDRAQGADLADLVRRNGQLLVVDPNVRPALVADVPAYRDGFRRLAAVAQVVKLSEQDAADLGLLDPLAAAEELLGEGVRLVLLTRGAAGATVLTGAGPPVDLPVPARTMPVVDTMGAGDATLAVLAAAVAREGVEVSAARWNALALEAMELAADVCRVAGGSLPIARPLRGSTL